MAGMVIRLKTRNFLELDATAITIIDGDGEGCQGGAHLSNDDVTHYISPKVPGGGIPPCPHPINTYASKSIV